MSSRKRPRSPSPGRTGAGWPDEPVSRHRRWGHTSGHVDPEPYSYSHPRSIPSGRLGSPGVSAGASRRYRWMREEQGETHQRRDYRRDEGGEKGRSFSDPHGARHSHSGHWRAHRHGDSGRPSPKKGQSHSQTSVREPKPEKSDSGTPICKRTQEQSDFETASTKQPRLANQYPDKKSHPHSQRTRDSSPSPTHSVLHTSPAHSMLHTTQLPDYYRLDQDGKGVSATDALRQLHQSFVDTLLAWRNIPLEFSLLAPPDHSTDSEKMPPGEKAAHRNSQTSVSGEDRPLPDIGTADSGREPPHGDTAGSNTSDASAAGGFQAQEGGSSSALLPKRADDVSTGDRRAKGSTARGSYLDYGGRSECGLRAERDKPSFSVKPAIHSSLCCNTPAKFCEGATLRKRQPRSRQHSISTSGPEVIGHICSHPAHYHNYNLTVSPEINFKANRPTVITGFDGKNYNFAGFCVISSNTLDNIPPRVFHCYGSEYTLHLKREPLPQNFSVKDVLLFEEYLFVGLLELFDWAETLKPFSNVLMFLPRFVVPVKGRGCEVLAMSEVLRYLVRSYKPLIQPGDRSREVELSRQMYGLLVTHPAKSPSAVRVDRVEWPKERGKGNPRIVHCSSWINDRSQQDEEQKDRQAYVELQEKAAKGKLKRREYFEQTELKHKLASGQAKSDHREMFIDFPSDGFYSTGIYADIIQHTLLLPIISQHILFHDSLHILEEQLQYRFKDRQLLQRALTHPSHLPLFGTSKAHLRTVMSNCGLKRPEHASRTAGGAGRKGSGLDTLVEDIGKGEGREDERIWHNEQLEFLGDAALEYLCSLHLYHIFPHLTDGQLTMYRRVLVKNKHLSSLASQVHLGDYMLLAEDVSLTEAGFAHATANCLEAVLGAVFLDGGLSAVDKLFGRLVFQEEDLYRVWMNYPADPLQQENVAGDRHMIPQSEFLQRLPCTKLHHSIIAERSVLSQISPHDRTTLKRLVPLEQSVGVEFRHIRLLARAFMHSSVGYTNLTRGSYQRLEFLGDAVLQFLVSDYAYRRLPAHHEGHLSYVRMLLVHNKELAKLSQQLTFDKYILSSKTEDIQMTGKILADVVESFLAALLLDKGLVFAKRFLEVSLFPKLADLVKSSELMDPNTRMHQAAAYTCRREGTAITMPEYRTLRNEGPSNSPLFTVGVFFRGGRIGVGKGPNLREARMVATENALASGVLMLPPSQKQVLK